MDFSQKVNRLFDGLGCTSADIAKLADMHPSGISRFRQGKRIPTPRSGQLGRLCMAIVNYATDHDSLEKLYELCGFDEKQRTGKLSDHLFRWLFEGYVPYTITLTESFLEEDSGKFFSDKLNYLMRKMEISSARLAESLHIDSSVISRLRNRVRIPSGSTIAEISGFFYDRACGTDRLDELVILTGMPDECRQNREQAVLFLSIWMGGRDENPNRQIMDNFLNQMDSFTPETFPPLPELSAIAPIEIRGEATSCYYGIEGLRRAVVRFLGNAAFRENPATLMLYSDQRMDWMTADPNYRKAWAALMVYTLRAKNRIRIIHNIDRELPEMVHAIEGWLPLYMSGLLEAHVHKKSAGERFAHTMFIAPGSEAVVACFPIGMEDEAEYRYITGDQVEYYVSQHEMMVTASTPIVRMFVPGDTEGLLLLERQLAEGSGELCKLLSAPSLETMSDETLGRILDRAGLDKTVRRRIETHHTAKRELHLAAMQSGSVREYIHLPEDGDCQPMSLNMGDLFLDMELFYTEEEYRAHLADMERWAARESGYDFVAIRESVFDNLQIVVKPDVGALVLKSGTASVSCGYWHPMMANAYYSYLNELLGDSPPQEHGWR